MVVMPLLRWWLLLELLGLVGLPISMWLLPSLPERGACFRRPVALLLSSYVLWLLVTLGLLQNTTASAAFALCLVACASFVLFWPRRRELLRELSSLKRVLLIEAVLFLASLMLFGLFRAYNPEIAATEKPMEFAFLNGILQSRTFPPHDPWLSGYSISYYYMGYVISAMLTRLSALPSDVTFNLTGIALFALTVSGSFALVYDLVAHGRMATDGRARGAFGYGALGAVLVALMGNLEGVLELVRARGWGSAALFRWFDVRNLGVTGVSANWFPDDMWWWWRASRVIHDRDLSGATQEVISEFPFFSFLLGDNHPHVLALPFVLLALALALSFLYGARRLDPEDTSEAGAGSFLARLQALLGWAGGTGKMLVTALLLGSLAFLNTWDYPIYFALVLSALAIARYRGDSRGTKGVGDTIVLAAGLGLVGVVAYFPFFLSLRTQAGGIGAVGSHIKTPLQQFLLMFGVQVALVFGMLVAMLCRQWAFRRDGGLPVLAWIWIGLLGAGTIAALGATWWAAALCLFILWLAGTLLILKATRGARLSPEEPGFQSLFVLLLVVAGALLLVAVEFVYLRDVFDSRMNTVFKFYYQGWVLLSLSAVYGAWYLVQSVRGGGRATAILSTVWLIVCALLVVAGLGYTAAATVSKANAFGGIPTLNGTAYVAEQRPLQYGVIEFLRREAEPDAVIVEAAGGSYSVQNWISAHSGLNSLLGWAGHERQWRGSGALPAEREGVVNSIYTASDVGETRRLLEDFGVDYVIVGPDEREQYGVGTAILAKFDVLMSRVFENDAYVVFARTW